MKTLARLMVALFVLTGILATLPVGIGSAANSTTKFKLSVSQLDPAGGEAWTPSKPAGAWTFSLADGEGLPLGQFTDEEDLELAEGEYLITLKGPTGGGAAPAVRDFTLSATGNSTCKTPDGNEKALWLSPSDFSKNGTLHACAFIGATPASPTATPTPAASPTAVATASPTSIPPTAIATATPSNEALLVNTPVPTATPAPTKLPELRKSFVSAEDSVVTWRLELSEPSGALVWDAKIFGCQEFGGAACGRILDGGPGEFTTGDGQYLLVAQKFEMDGESCSVKNVAEWAATDSDQRQSVSASYECSGAPTMGWALFGLFASGAVGLAYVVQRKYQWSL